MKFEKNYLIETESALCGRDDIWTEPNGAFSPCVAAKNLNVTPPTPPAESGINVTILEIGRSHSTNCLGTNGPVMLPNFQCGEALHIIQTEEESLVNETTNMSSHVETYVMFGISNDSNPPMAVVFFTFSQPINHTFVEIDTVTQFKLKLKFL